MDERKIDDVRTWRTGDELRVEVKAKVVQVFSEGGRRVHLDYKDFSSDF